MKMTRVLGTALAATMLLSGAAFASNGKPATAGHSRTEQSKQGGENQKGDDRNEGLKAQLKVKLAEWQAKNGQNHQKDDQNEQDGENDDDDHDNNDKNKKDQQKKQLTEAEKAAQAAFKQQVQATVKPSVEAYVQAKQETKAVVEQIKPQAEQLKETAQQVKEAIKGDPAKQEALKQELAPIKEQAKGLKAQLVALREQLKAAWESFRTARKSQDAAGMKVAADQATTTQVEMNGVLGQFLTLMQQKLAILTQYK